MEIKSTMDIKATYEQHKNFAGSIVWMDIYHELTLWLDDARNHLESETDMAQVHHLQGICEALRRVIELPGTILEVLELPQRLELDNG